MNIIRQATEMGIKNFSVISSVGAIWDRNNIKPLYSSNGTITFDRRFTTRKLTSSHRRTDWNPITRDEILYGTIDPLASYSGTKTFAERAVWKFASAHPDMNLTVCKHASQNHFQGSMGQPTITVNPPFFIGPLAPGFRVPLGDKNALSTNKFIYDLLFASNQVETPAMGFVDVRDVAIGLVKGQKTQGKHRIIFGGEWFTYQEAIDYITSVHPELQGRLATAAPTAQKNSLLDISTAAVVLGLAPRPWRVTIHDAVEDLLKLHKSWIE